jgi:hypothetical protein
MKMRELFLLAVGLLLVLPAAAQDRKQPPSPAKASAAVPEKTSNHAVSLTGYVGESGKSFLVEAESRIWKVLNPDSLEKLEGQHVVVNARVNATNDAVFITSVKPADDRRGSIKFDDVAFRR